jgi:cytosine/adenosine deaminase-related metal-dependent hydrolase
VNAVVVADDGSLAETLRVRGRVVDGIDARPQKGDAIVDADGSVICAGFINAHDHLELNSFRRLKWRDMYTNVREWIEDFQPRFASDPALADARAETLADRLWVGGLKNLLCGVTTVSHHNPLHRPLHCRFPVRVVRRFGLSHSLYIDGSKVVQSFRRTRRSWPWIIHAAEGIDDAARTEVGRLAAMRCLASNTVLVHGVGLDEQGITDALTARSSLVWCPSSNAFLFGRTAHVRPFALARRLALGSDSRLSGTGDLLDELHAAACSNQLSPGELLRTVTTDAAAVLRLESVGRLAPNRRADLVMLRRVAADPFESIVRSTRTDVRLTMIDGMPLVADAAMRPAFDAVRQAHTRVRVDHEPRLMARWIARRAAAMTLREPGLEVVS